MFIDRVYLGKRKFRSSIDGKCSIVVNMHHDNEHLRMSLFEGDSQVVAINTALKTFTPLGHTHENIYFKDIEKIS